MKSVELIKLPYYQENDGELSVAEGQSNTVPFPIARIFNVRAQRGSVRGRHAHRECIQLLICTNGSIKVTCDNAIKTSSYILDKMNYGLIINPGIWAEQKYMKDNSILTVLCNLPYDENDYIRDYKGFLKHKFKQ